jgi:hypothetical protein
MSGVFKELVVVGKSTVLTISDGGIGIVVSRRVDHSNSLFFFARHLSVAICVSEAVQKLQNTTRVVDLVFDFCSGGFCCGSVCAISLGIRE